MDVMDGDDDIAVDLQDLMSVDMDIAPPGPCLKCQQLQAEIEKLQNYVSNLSEVRKKIIDTNELIKLSTALRSDNERLTLELQHRERALAKALTTMEPLQQEKLKFEKSFNEMSQKFSKMKEEHGSIKEGKRQMEFRMEELEANLLKLKSQNKGMQERIRELEGKMRKLTDDNELQRSRAIELKKQNTLLTSQNQRLQKVVSGLEERGVISKRRLHKPRTGSLSAAINSIDNVSYIDVCNQILSSPLVSLPLPLSPMSSLTGGSDTEAEQGFGSDADSTVDEIAELLEAEMIPVEVTVSSNLHCNSAQLLKAEVNCDAPTECCEYPVQQDSSAQKTCLNNAKLLKAAVKPVEAIGSSSLPCKSAEKLKPEVNCDVTIKCSDRPSHQDGSELQACRSSTELYYQGRSAEPCQQLDDLSLAKQTSPVSFDTKVNSELVQAELDRTSNKLSLDIGDVLPAEQQTVKVDDRMEVAGRQAEMAANQTVCRTEQPLVQSKEQTSDIADQVHLLVSPCEPTQYMVGLSSEPVDRREKLTNPSTEPVPHSSCVDGSASPVLSEQLVSVSAPAASVATAHCDEWAAVLTNDSSNSSSVIQLFLLESAVQLAQCGSSISETLQSCEPIKSEKTGVSCCDEQVNNAVDLVEPVGQGKLPNAERELFTATEVDLANAESADERHVPNTPSLTLNQSNEPPQSSKVTESALTGCIGELVVRASEEIAELAEEPASADSATASISRAVLDKSEVSLESVQQNFVHHKPVCISSDELKQLGPLNSNHSSEHSIDISPSKSPAVSTRSLSKKLAVVKASVAANLEAPQLESTKSVDSVLNDSDVSLKLQDLASSAQLQSASYTQSKPVPASSSQITRLHSALGDSETVLKVQDLAPSEPLELAPRTQSEPVPLTSIQITPLQQSELTQSKLPSDEKPVAREKTTQSISGSEGHQTDKRKKRNARRKKSCKLGMTAKLILDELQLPPMIQTIDPSTPTKAIDKMMLIPDAIVTVIGTSVVSGFAPDCGEAVPPLLMPSVENCSAVIHEQQPERDSQHGVQPNESEQPLRVATVGACPVTNGSQSPSESCLKLESCIQLNESATKAVSEPSSQSAQSSDSGLLFDSIKQNEIATKAVNEPLSQSAVTTPYLNSIQSTSSVDSKIAAAPPTKVERDLKSKAGRGLHCGDAEPSKSTIIVEAATATHVSMTATNLKLTRSDVALSCSSVRTKKSAAQLKRSKSLSKLHLRRDGDSDLFEDRLTTYGNDQISTSDVILPLQSLLIPSVEDILKECVLDFLPLSPISLVSTDIIAMAASQSGDKIPADGNSQNGKKNKKKKSNSRKRKSEETSHTSKIPRVEFIIGNEEDTIPIAPSPEICRKSSSDTYISQIAPLVPTSQRSLLHSADNNSFSRPDANQLSRAENQSANSAARLFASSKPMLPLCDDALLISVIFKTIKLDVEFATTSMKYSDTASSIAKQRPTTAVFVSAFVQAVAALSVDVISKWKYRCQEPFQTTSTPWLDDVDIRLLSVLFAYHNYDCNVVEEFQKNVAMMLSTNAAKFSYEFSYEGRSALCRLFTAICRTQGDRERVRVLIFDIALRHRASLLHILVTIAGIWPDILTTEKTVQETMLTWQPVISSLEYVVFGKTFPVKAKKLAKCNELKLCLEKLCAWSFQERTLAQHVIMLFSWLKLQLANHQSTTSELPGCVYDAQLSLSLLSTVEDWVSLKAVVLDMMMLPVLDQCLQTATAPDSYSHYIVGLVGCVLCRCVKTLQCVEGYLDKLTRLLGNDQVGVDIQRSALRSILTCSSLLSSSHSEVCVRWIRDYSGCYDSVTANLVQSFSKQFPHCLKAETMGR